jgi:hypothetical protein
MIRLLGLVIFLRKSSNFKHSQEFWVLIASWVLHCIRRDGNEEHSTQSQSQSFRKMWMWMNFYFAKKNWNRWLSIDSQEMKTKYFAVCIVACFLVVECG